MSLPLVASTQRALCPGVCSSTGEASAPEDYLWLMSRASYKPVIEYCGGEAGSLSRPCLAAHSQLKEVLSLTAACTPPPPPPPPQPHVTPPLCSQQRPPALHRTRHCRHRAGWRLLFGQPAAAAGTLHLLHPHHWPSPRRPGGTARRQPGAEPAWRLRRCTPAGAAAAAAAAFFRSRNDCKDANIQTLQCAAHSCLCRNHGASVCQLGTGASMLTPPRWAACPPRPPPAVVTGELALSAPALGSSQRLLNKDHAAAYYEGMPTLPDGRWATSGTPACRNDLTTCRVQGAHKFKLSSVAGMCARQG